MEKETFDGLRARLTDLLGKDTRTLKNIIEELMRVKENIDPVIFENIISDIELLGEDKGKLGEGIDLLHEKGIVDGLTSLYTKTYLDEVINDFKGPVAYLMGDVDKFKSYNDTYGHQQGNVALELIANRFKEVVENSVCNEESSFVARYGGEELSAFIEIFNRDIYDLRAIGDLICSSVKNIEIPLHPDAESTKRGYERKTITIAGTISKPGESMNQLIERTDQVLIVAKKEDKRGKAHILNNLDTLL